MHKVNPFFWKKHRFEIRTIRRRPPLGIGSRSPFGLKAGSSFLKVERLAKINFARVKFERIAKVVTNFDRFSHLDEEDYSLMHL